MGGLFDAAEFEITEGELYHTLFLLPSTYDTYQAILPSFDVNTQKFNINPMFEEPLYINSPVNPRYQNNRFQLLSETISATQKNIIAIDMKKKDVAKNTYFFKYCGQK